MKTTVLRQAKFDKSNLIQIGGEGAVYAHNGSAVKQYTYPNHMRSEKLKSFLAMNLAARLPANVLVPKRLLIDEHDVVTAFEMALLPPTTLPLKKLSQSPFCQQLAIDLAYELELLVDLGHDLKEIHASNVIVGDLNDHNIYFDPATHSGRSSHAARMNKAKCYWIDVDSFQFGPFPCPVALQDFLDPHLYGVNDFSSKPVFSRESDWYAFSVLLCKLLLKTHPFGGTHHQLKTVRSRAEAGVSVFQPAVTYPKSARPSFVLNDELLTYLQRVFEEGHRAPAPLVELQALRNNLTHCPACEQLYSASRPHCPSCHRQSRRVTSAPQTAALRVRKLLHTAGIISQVFVGPSDTITVVTRQGDTYRLVELRSGEIIHEQTLFSGNPGAHFGLFRETLVINPASRRELLLVDIGDSGPRLLQTLDSERFEGEAVFATTPQALYRIAAGCILRGEVRHGRYLEEIIATAHRWRTRFWASPSSDRLAGFHRRFGDSRFFTIDEEGRQFEITPATPSSSALRNITAIDVAWDRRNVAFIWHEKAGGALEHHLQVVDMQGKTRHQATSAFVSAPFDRLDGRLLNTLTVLHPTDQGILKVQPNAQVLLHDLAPSTSAGAILHWHSAGVLIQDSNTLSLAETA